MANLFINNLKINGFTKNIKTKLKTNVFCRLLTDSSVYFRKPHFVNGTLRSAVCIKCLFFDDEMCTLQKVSGEDSKGRRVL